MNIAALFPGQGSQIVGMGRDFFEKSELACELFECASSALGFSLSNLCFEGPLEKLTLTSYAQPAILTVSTIAFNLLRQKVTAAAGHSLGEYSALVAAGVINFADAVQLVHKRGKYMQEAVPPNVGKMLAIMGSTPEEIKEVALSVAEQGVVEIANINSPGQTVVAGNADAVDSFAKLIAEKGAKAIPLNVSAPFHCSLMKPAADALAKDLDSITFSEPAFPVYANVTGQAIRNGIEARQLLKDQVCGSVLWSTLIENMISEQQISRAIEYGPGGVLSKLMKRIDKSVKAYELSDCASLEKVKAEFNQ